MKAHSFYALLIVLLFASCSKSSSPGEPKLDSSVDGLVVSYASNQRFVLELDLQADAGYQWEYSIGDTNVVRIDSTSYRPKSCNWNQVGGVTIETFYFHTMRLGSSVVELIEHRVWEPNVPPIDKMKFTVLVYP